MNKLLYLFLIISMLLNICCRSGDQPETVETIFFDVNGGEHTYPNGITLRLPPGALTEGKNIFIRNLNTNEMTSLLSIRAIPEENILFAFEGGPDSLTFEESVTVIIPVERLTKIMVPVIMHINLSDNSASVANVSYKADPENKTIELSINHLTGYSAEIIEEIHRNECTDAFNTSCRCGIIEVIQNDNEYSCSRENCQVVYSENRVKFLDCPGSPEESSIFEEVSSGCIAELTMKSEKIYIESGEQCEITAKIKLGCAAPMEAKDVTFSVTGPGTISPYDDFTDDQGIARTNLTAGSQEGKVTITGISSFAYYKKRINVNGVDLVSEEQTVNLVNSVDVYVIKKPVLEVFAEDEVIAKNDITTISATITRNGAPVEGQIVNFSVTGPADVAPVSSTTSSSGSAVTFLAAHDLEGTANVTAESDVTVLLPNGYEIRYPVNASVSVVIAEEEDLDGSVWRFESIIETTTLFNPQGCEDVYVKPDCSCRGDYTGIMLTETAYQSVTGKFTLTRTTGHSGKYSVSFSDVSGSLQFHHPSSQYSTTCPLGGGMGVPGCACEDPHFIRIDAWGDDEINESVSFHLPTPSTDEIEAFTYSYSGNFLDIRFHKPSEPVPFIKYKTCYSSYSDCSCIGWDGQKSYDYWPAWEFSNWRWSGNLENGQWSETDQWQNTTEITTFSLECISDCNN
jgi:hypothetical protein